MNKLNESNNQVFGLSILTVSRFINSGLNYGFIVFVSALISQTQTGIVAFLLYANTFTLLVILTQSIRNSIARIIAEFSFKLSFRNLPHFAPFRFLIFLLFVVIVLLTFLWQIGIYPYTPDLFLLVVISIIPLFIVPISNGVLQGHQRYGLFGFAGLFDGSMKLITFFILLIGNINPLFGSIIAYLSGAFSHMLCGIILIIVSKIYKQHINHPIDNQFPKFSSSLANIDLTLVSIFLALLINLDVFLVQELYPTQVETYGIGAILLKPFFYIANIGATYIISIRDIKKQKKHLQVFNLFVGILFGSYLTTLLIFGSSIHTILYPNINYSVPLFLSQVVYHMTCGWLTVLIFRRLRFSPGSKRNIFVVVISPLVFCVFFLNLPLEYSVLLATLLLWFLVVIEKFLSTKTE